MSGRHIIGSLLSLVMAGAAVVGCSGQRSERFVPPDSARSTPDKEKSDRARAQAATAEAVPPTVAAQRGATPTATPTMRPPATATATSAATAKPAPPTNTPRPQPTPMPQPTAAVQQTPTAGRAGCDASYPTVCIPPPPPDLDCPEVPFKRFKVLPPDPHGFDRDRDGIGCES